MSAGDVVNGPGGLWTRVRDAMQAGRCRRRRRRAATAAAPPCHASPESRPPRLPPARSSGLGALLRQPPHRPPASQTIQTAGSGSTPKAGDNIGAHYTGTLTNGTKFDSSRDKGRVFKFQVGIGQVIKCWDEGMLTMQVGERAIIKCKPGAGYGAQGAGGVIPPNADLIFDVELMSIN